jgi:hypothetical protein
MVMTSVSLKHKVLIYVWMILQKTLINNELLNFDNFYHMHLKLMKMNF